MAANAKAPRVRNAVHDAAIWRQTVHYELTTAQNWERYWGFMKDAMIENEEAIKRGRLAKGSKTQVLPPIKKASQPDQKGNDKVQPQFTSGLPSKLPPGIVQENDHPIVGDFLTTYRIPEIIRTRLPAQKYRVPCTTSSEVGWIWGHAQDPSVPFDGDTVSGVKKNTKFHTLERFPREAYGKGDVLKWWGAALLMLRFDSFIDADLIFLLSFRVNIDEFPFPPCDIKSRFKWRTIKGVTIPSNAFKQFSTTSKATGSCQYGSKNA
ncbi:hypothetical protein BDR26DRAFT_1007956 [Obelidium mucronatum]|nr:hypothetical protein BDR26DRAFT_1007956 [Obelidium mucronatum]